MNQIRERLADILSLWFGKAREIIAPDTNLVTELGLSPFDMEVLSYAIEETFAVTINPPTIAGNPTLSALSTIIKKQTSTAEETLSLATPLFDILRGTIAERLEISEDRIEISSHIREDLGADDLDMYELIYACEEAFGVEIPDDVHTSLQTVRDVLHYLSVARSSEQYRASSNRTPVFVSYVRNDRDVVMRFVRALQRYGIEIWIDRFEIQPGQNWKVAIRKAIDNGMFFIACFSSNYWKRQENLMNEELQIAIEKMRRMHDERIWFIPVKLTPCSLPEFEIRSGKLLDSKQWVELFENWDQGIWRIVRVIKSAGE